jgi:hypothetical protein
MRFSLRTWLTFFVLALLMGLNNVYSTLLTGWGDGGSIVAVILCLLLLPSRDANIRNYNLGQTIASAGGSVGFTVAILASLYVWHAQQGEIWEPALFPLALLSHRRRCAYGRCRGRAHAALHYPLVLPQRGGLRHPSQSRHLLRPPRACTRHPPNDYQRASLCPSHPTHQGRFFSLGAAPFGLTFLCPRALP